MHPQKTSMDKSTLYQTLLIWNDFSEGVSYFRITISKCDFLYSEIDFWITYPILEYENHIPK